MTVIFDMPKECDMDFWTFKERFEEKEVFEVFSVDEIGPCRCVAEKPMQNV